MKPPSCAIAGETAHQKSAKAAGIARRTRRVSAVHRRLRDLRFNPDRNLSEPISDEQRIVIAAKREAIAGPLTSRRERIAIMVSSGEYFAALSSRLNSTCSNSTASSSSIGRSAASSSETL